MAMTPAERVKKWRDNHPDEQQARNYVYIRRYVAWKKIKFEFLAILQP